MEKGVSVGELGGQEHGWVDVFRGRYTPKKPDPK